MNGAFKVRRSEFAAKIALATCGTGGTFSVEEDRGRVLVCSVEPHAEMTVHQRRSFKRGLSAPPELGRPYHIGIAHQVVAKQVAAGMLRAERKAGSSGQTAHHSAETVGRLEQWDDHFVLDFDEVSFAARHFEG